MSDDKRSRPGGVQYSCLKGLEPSSRIDEGLEMLSTNW